MTPKQITFKNPPNSVEVSSACPFNCDGTRLLLLASNLPAVLDHFALYDGDGNFLKHLPIAASQEPRWSRTDPETFYFIHGHELLWYMPSEDIQHSIHTFPEYASISGLGESDISADGDHFVFAGVRSDASIEVFNYSLKDGKSPTYTTPKPIDGLKITASNLEIVSYADGSGIWILDSPPRKLASANGHAAVATYNGRDVLLWCSSDDAQIDKNAVVMIYIDDGTMEILAEFDAAKIAFHISAPLNLPWCVVSTDCPDRSLPSEIWRVFYDRTIPKEWICNTGSLFTVEDTEIKAAVDSAGTRVVGCSNFGKTADPNYCDVFMVELAVKEIITPVMDSNYTRIDYAPYVGKSQFIIKPQLPCRTCGSTISGIYERKI